MNSSHWNSRQASSLSSSAVIGPVVSWDPTVVIFGSQADPGRTPSTPQALPTIFWASVNPWPGFGLGIFDLGEEISLGQPERGPGLVRSEPGR